jgi:hypothetical protein
VVDDADQVRNDRHEGVSPASSEVLVLEGDLERISVVGPERRDHSAPLREPLGRTPLDIDDLADAELAQVRVEGDGQRRGDRLER